MNISIPIISISTDMLYFIELPRRLSNKNKSMCMRRVKIKQAVYKSFSVKWIMKSLWFLKHQKLYAYDCNFNCIKSFKALHIYCWCDLLYGEMKLP